MKFSGKYRFWFISLAAHLCVGIILAYVVAFNQPPLNPTDVIDISLLKVTRLPVTQRPASVEKIPVVVPPPKPDLQIQPQSTAAPTRSLVHSRMKTAVRSTASVAAVDVSASPLQTQAAKVSLSAPQARKAVAPIATIADLPVENDSPLAAGVSGGELSESDGGHHGNLRGKGAYGSGNSSGVEHLRNRTGLTSLVTQEGTANLDDSLSEVTDHMLLGNEAPQLPEGEPGAIVVGRGRDISGRLNLVRLEDPLHPSADI